MKQTYNKYIVRKSLEAIVIKNVVHRKGKTYENIICWRCSRISGRGMIQQYVPALKKKYTVTIINGENAAGGRGITEKYTETFRMRSTSGYIGNHAWDNREVFEFIDDAKYLARPANFPEGTPKRAYFCEL